MARGLSKATFVTVWILGGIPIFMIGALSAVIAYIIVRPKGLL